MKGDASKGKDQFQLAGCLACHELGEGEARVVGKPNPYGQYGPNLAGIASKVTEPWLYQWLKEPHKYWAETRMPNLRLADDEAANIAAFLMTQVKADWKPVKPPVDPRVLEKEALTFLTSKFSVVDSQEYLKTIREGKFDMLVGAGVVDKKTAPRSRSRVRRRSPTTSASGGSRARVAILAIGSAASRRRSRSASS